MDGSNERQGVLNQLASMSLAELREMLARQERLAKGDLLDRLPDRGQKVKLMQDRLRQHVAEREASNSAVFGRPSGVEAPHDSMEEDEDEDEDEATREIRNILLRTATSKKVISTRQSQSRKFVPNRPRNQPIPEEDESKAVTAITDMFKETTLESAVEAEEEYPVPALSDDEWTSKAEAFRPPPHCRQFSGVARQSLNDEVSDLPVVLVDLLTDPSADGKFIQLYAQRLRCQRGIDTLTADSTFCVNCQPSYIGSSFSTRCGMKIRMIVSQDKTETTDAVAVPTLWSADSHQQLPTRPTDDAVSSWWQFLTFRDNGHPRPYSSVLFLILPPPKGCAGQRKTLMAILRRAFVDITDDACLLLDLARCQWSSQLSRMLHGLHHDLDPRARCQASVNFLKAQLAPSTDVPRQLWAAGPVVRLSDHLRRLNQAALCAANLATFQHRLINSLPSVISEDEANSLASRGWDYNRLERAFTAGWPVFLPALFSRIEADKEENVNVARRLFKHFQMKFKKMAYHRGELLPDDDLVATRARTGGVQRRAIFLPLSDSWKLTLQQDSAARQKVLNSATEQLERRALSSPLSSDYPRNNDFLNKEYRDPAMQDDQEEAEEEEEGEACFERYGMASDSDDSEGANDRTDD